MATLSPTDSVEYEDEAEELITGEAVALDLRAAGFILRAAGSALDLIAYNIVYIVIIIVVAMLPGFADLDGALVQALGVVLYVLYALVIPVVVEVLSHGRSLGKLAVGARIVRDDGGAIGLRHAAIRGVVGLLEIFGSLGMIALLVAIFNPKAKRIGDYLAGTYSQLERIPRYNTPVYGVPLVLTEWAKTADVARMPDALARRIAHYLAQARGLSPETRTRLGRQLANEASIYVSPLPTVDAELFLAAVASLRRDREFTALQLEQRRLEKLRPVLSGLPHKFPSR